MRRGKRFTPGLLRKWMSEGRGLGTFDDYQPWHQVTRSDPASRGLSRFIPGLPRKRSSHLLSDHEYLIWCFIKMLRGLRETREQYPLSRDEHPIELAQFQSHCLSISAPGTLQLARELGIKHPVVRLQGESENWVLSTDFLLYLVVDKPEGHLLAISAKLDEDLARKRTKQLLTIEREYWAQQGVEWLLLTPSTYNQGVGYSLKTSAAFVIDEATVPTKDVDIEALVRHVDGQTLANAFAQISRLTGLPRDRAGRLFWQEVWASRIPVDLSRLSQPGDRVTVVDRSAFLQQNPIFARRTACL